MLIEQRGLQLLLAVSPHQAGRDSAGGHEDGKDHTGLGLVWQAATDMLCDYLEAHASTLFSGDSAWDEVCELGAGAGVCGMLAGRLGAHRVVLTDYHPSVLTLLRANVERNGLGGRCEVVLLAWSEASTGAEAGLRPACTEPHQSLLLIGSDLAPSEVAARLLGSTTSRLLSSAGDTRRAVFLYAHRERHAVYLNRQSGAVEQEKSDSALEVLRQSVSPLTCTLIHSRPAADGGGKGGVSLFAIGTAASVAALPQWCPHRGAAEPAVASEPPDWAAAGEKWAGPPGTLAYLDPCAGCCAQLAVDHYRADGFVVIERLISPEAAELLAHRLERVLRGEYDTGVPPDKRPKPPKGAGALGFSGERRGVRTVHLINVWKSDAAFARLARSAALGELVARLAGWESGARLAQDQVWAKPPGAPPLVFHRDSPYFDFAPASVVTVWVALDEMREELGPLQYVRGSHAWGDGRRGSASSFFDSDTRGLLRSAAEREGIDPCALDGLITSVAGLRPGGCSIHDGRTWHGSGPNASASEPRRGLGIHYIPADATFKPGAKLGKLWEPLKEAGTDGLPEAELPVVWRPNNFC